MTPRLRHPKSRPLPGPRSDPPAFIAAAGNLVASTVQCEVMKGATPQAALLAAARELIRQAQELSRLMPADGGPRFTVTR